MIYIFYVVGAASANQKPQYTANSIPNGPSTSHNTSHTPATTSPPPPPPPSASAYSTYSVPRTLRTFGDPTSQRSAGGSRGPQNAPLMTDTMDRDQRFIHASAQPVHVLPGGSGSSGSSTTIPNGPVLVRSSPQNPSVVRAQSPQVRAQSPGSGTYGTASRASPAPMYGQAHSGGSMNTSRSSLTNNAAVNSAYTGPETDMDTLTRPPRKVDDGYYSNRSTSSHQGDGKSSTNAHFIDGVCSKDVIV